MLLVVAQKWHARRLPAPVNRRPTSSRGQYRGGLPRTRCAAARQPMRTVRVRRPAKDHTSQQGLCVSCRALPRGRFGICWLAFTGTKEDHNARHECTFSLARICIHRSRLLFLPPPPVLSTPKLPLFA
jgi:hypothetical protein